MKVNRDELITALETVKAGLSSKEMIEQSTSFCFKEGRVITFNDNIGVSCPVPDLEIEGAVNSTEFYSFITKAKTKEISMEASENEIVFKAGRSKAGMSLNPTIVLPIEEIGKIDKWKAIPSDFLKALSFAMAACSSDMSRPKLTCVHVNAGVVEGADSYRLTQFELEKEMEIPKFLIPATSCSTVIRFKPLKIAAGSGWVHFKNEVGAILSCRLFEEEYVNIGAHLKVKGTKIVFPKSIKEVVERASIFSKRDHIIDETITIAVTEGKMEVKSTSDAGWFSEKVKADFEGDDLEFKIAPHLLKHILTDTDTGTVSDTKLVFKGKNWIYLTMLKA